ncbi:hypothetical protein Taro_022923 [Colocasia esculenta]|uniref:Uncharacterized protein n=1 Tax=Colocasia esculenta TaxID=4460 RepID=A0A843V6Q7_COLES|nr:hypothetical protein [Colocasia esculenta]
MPLDFSARPPVPCSQTTIAALPNSLVRQGWSASAKLIPQSSAGSSCINLVSEIRESASPHQPRSSPRCATTFTEGMVAEGSSVRWRLSEDPIWISIKNELRELRDMFAAAIPKTDCETDPILDVKCEEQEQVAIYESDSTLADNYEVKMQVQFESQDLHNDQVTPQNMLSETSSLVRL